jgi:hypothetical protein
VNFYSVFGSHSKLCENSLHRTCGVKRLQQAKFSLFNSVLMTRRDLNCNNWSVDRIGGIFLAAGNENHSLVTTKTAAATDFRSYCTS